jgi:hypothetical protein
MKNSHPEGDIMRKVQMRCAECGDVTLPAAEITVTETPDREQVTVTYSCPDCESPCELTFGVVAGRMLLLSGAGTKPTALPPLTLADVHTLCALMDQPDFVTRMRDAA